MNSEEMDRLADYLAMRLREVGETEIADPRHYTLVNEETDEEFLVAPRKRISLMLEALERSTDLLDQETYFSARKRLQKNVQNMEDVDIVIERVDLSDGHRVPFRFDSLESRGTIRSEIVSLRERIIADSEGQ